LVRTFVSDRPVSVLAGSAAFESRIRLRSFSNAPS
jgi:hypothetical protein